MRSTDTAAGCSANASAPRKIPEGQPLEIRILRTDVIPGVPSRDVLSGNCHVVDHVDFGQVNSCPGVEKVQEADCGMGFAACLIQKKPRVSPFWRPLSRPTVASRKAIGAVPALQSHLETMSTGTDTTCASSSDSPSYTPTLAAVADRRVSGPRVFGHEPLPSANCDAALPVPCSPRAAP
mmetsp:Transcript_19784/g.43917  ORF Transcript_19784/g.43917 Transcript_19784/m.43917 type:complete len:180 (-) Transcript_19784:51-590(-)